MNTFERERRAFLGNVARAGLAGLIPFNAVKIDRQVTDTAPNGFLTEPYLQHMKGDGVTVMWIAAANSIHWVEIEGSDGAVRKVVNAHHGLVDANGRLAKIRIDDLKPGTMYQYKIFSKTIEVFEPYKIVYGEIVEKGPFKFTTPAETEDKVSFVVLNDVHDLTDNITEMLGKYADVNEYDFVVFNGDMFNWVDDEQQIIDHFLNPVGGIFSAQRPFLLVQGNHEVRGKYARQLFDYFDYPDNRCYYAFTRGPVRFVVLDSGEDKDDDNVEYSGLVSFDAYREEQERWLKKEIHSKEFKKAAFRVVLIHIPVFHAGEGHGTQHGRKLFNPLFNEGKIDLAISGHTHRYGTFDADPATHHYPIVIGGGCGTATRKGGPRTIIKVSATAKNLSLQMLNEDGKVVGSYNLNK